MLDRSHHSDTVLPHLRAWMSMVRVSTIIVGGMRRDATALAANVQAARSE